MHVGDQALGALARRDHLANVRKMVLTCVSVGGDLLASLAGRTRSDLDHFGDVNEMVVTCIDVGIDLLACLVGRARSARRSRNR